MASSKTEIIGNLNPEQRKAALHKMGVSAFVAGPGTGKTTAQVACAALKVISGFEPKSIAMITFTNKAASEMQERLVKHIDEDAYRVFVGTFHQLAIKKILRPFIKCEFLANKGFEPGFNIIDKSDSKQLINEAMSSLNESQRNQFDFANVDIKFLQNVMSKYKSLGFDWFDAKNSLTNVSELESFLTDNMPGAGKSDKQIESAFEDNYNARTLLSINWWSLYERQCINNNAMDFDDLMVNAAKLLKAHPELANRLGKSIQHLQIDEYQDTAPVQFEIVKSIIDCQKNKSAIAVGDMRQAIYGFRGADSTSMRKFVDYFNADVHSMNRNYRTAPSSIEAINQFGETMADQLTDGHLIAMSEADSPPPELKHFKTDKEESAFIAQQVKTLLDQGEKPDDIAIIYRAKALARDISAALDSERVQYDIVGDTVFYETKEVKIGIAVLRLFVNENDRFALHTLMTNFPIGISKTRLTKEASNKKCSQMEYLKTLAKTNSAMGKKISRLLNELTDIAHYIPALSDQELAASKNLSMEEFRHRMNFDRQFQELIKQQSAKFSIETAPLFAERIQHFFTNQILHSLNNETRKAIEKSNRNATEEQIEELLIEKLNQRAERVVKLTEIFTKTLETGVTFKDAVDEIMLLADNTKNNKDLSVKLMTGHASKGTEFNHVIFAGASQELFFREDEVDDDKIAEEERNLYVITTRHKKCLTMTHSDSRFLEGQYKHMKPLEMLVRFKGKIKNDSIELEAEQDNDVTTNAVPTLKNSLPVGQINLRKKLKSRFKDKNETNEPSPTTKITNSSVPEWAVPVSDIDDVDSEDLVDDFKFI